MKPAKKKRLILILTIFIVFATAVALVLYAMQKDLNHYYSLQSYANGEVPIEQAGIRVGGMVADGSLQREGETLNIEFDITDFKHDPMTVRYSGILPDLFREGQGVIATGTLGNDNVFYADSILAKHDENYMPPEVAEDMARSGYDHSQSSGQASTSSAENDQGKQ